MCVARIVYFLLLAIPISLAGSGEYYNYGTLYSQWCTEKAVWEWLIYGLACTKNSFVQLPEEVQGHIFAQIDPVQNMGAWKKDEPRLVETWHIETKINSFAADNHCIVLCKQATTPPQLETVHWSELAQHSIDERDDHYLKEHLYSVSYYLYHFDTKTFKRSRFIEKYVMPESSGDYYRDCEGVRFCSELRLNYNGEVFRGEKCGYHLDEKEICFGYTEKRYKKFRSSVYAPPKIEVELILSATIIKPYSVAAGATEHDARFLALLKYGNMKFSRDEKGHIRDDYQLVIDGKNQLVLRQNERNNDYCRQVRTHCNPLWLCEKPFAEYALPHLSSCMGYLNQLPSEDDYRFIAVSEDPKNSQHSILKIYVPSSKVCMQHYCIYQAYIAAAQIARFNKSHKIWKLFRRPAFERLIQATAVVYDRVAEFKEVGIIRSTWQNKTV